MKYSRLCLAVLVTGLLAAGCADKNGFEQVAPNQSDAKAMPDQAAVVVDGLASPIGMSVDKKGLIWVSQSGTGQNDGSVVVVAHNGDVQTVFTGFGSARLPNGELGGLGHVLYNDGVLYILDGLNGRLYIADVSKYKAKDAPVSASKLPFIELKTFVYSQNLSTPLDSNLYDLTFGPDGHLYIADAGANAIIKVNLSTRQPSVFARIPNINPMTQPVPTGIIYEGNRFLVTTLTGFPFTTGAAKILQISTSGVVSDYRTGFTALTNLAPTRNGGLLVTEYAQFKFTPPTFVGWLPSTGRVATEAGATVVGGLDRLTDIERINPNFYYVLSTGSGTISKIKY
ncbi:ScyD/ScyE family protein [Hymenobacter wooponensis]|uniref:ScyD/ScyE family protein n=1 Tax=Hymenobacter wooponensis TaxID=1525360 RepID=A0A4Z0MEU6_9BACT|nr:ScyD/ScyE family protein [Hymenobacter wooponensis]TGD77818.1 ScyD/ScyE family protein [Hymenobacter wooponensis]